MTFPPVWHSETGSPTLLAWAMALAYAWAAMQCFRAGRRAQHGRSPSLAGSAWWACAAVLGFLGVNKLMALQTLVFRTGGRVAIRGDWYAYRRPMQAAFAAAVILGSAMLGLALWKTHRSFFQRYSRAGIGLGCLLLFVLVRTASLSHVFEWCPCNPHDEYWAWVLECAGIMWLVHASRHP